MSTRPYNHFSFLRSVERLFHLPYLGYAASPDPGAFGSDVFTAAGAPGCGGAAGRVGGASSFVLCRGNARGDASCRVTQSQWQ